MTDEQRPEGGMPDPPPLAPLTLPAPPAAPAPQPAVAWAPPPAPVASGPGQRTVLALIAGIVMVLGAIFWGLIGLAVAVLGPTFINSMGDLGQFPGFEGGDPGSLLGGMMAFVGIILLLIALAYFIGGIGIIRNRGWGRVIGLILGILGGLLWLGGVTSPATGDGSSVGGAVLFLAIHAYMVVVLLFFWRSKSASA